MNVVDSSGWIEYFSEGPNVGFFAGAIERVDELIVPSLTLFEVFKWIARERNEVSALSAVAQMHQGEMIELNARLAIYAARLSLEKKLPMADSIVYATARIHRATLWTQDGDFEQFGEVKYIARKKASK